MPTILKISLPAPHPGQRKVLSEARRFSVVCCGRRWGKSTLGLDQIVKPALENHPVAWFSPSYKLLLEAWRSLQAVLEPVIVSRSNSEYRLELRGGGSVTMFSLDAETSDGTRGRAFKSVVVDEAAMVRNLHSVWETVIRPCLADYRGTAWFLSTPRGMNDFKAFYDRGQDPERADWASWQMPTSANPHISPEEIEQARQDMTEAAFAQEFLATFVSWEGAVFRHITEAATAQVLDGPEPGHQYTIGCDWGRSHDYTVFSVLDLTDKRMVAMDRSNKVDYTVQRGRLGALNERWKPSSIIAEQNSIGQPIIEALQRDGLPVVPFVTSNSSKATIIEALALAFEQGSISILNDAVLLGELQSFRAEELPGGTLRYSAPSGQHDDCVMSLAIAWSALRADHAMYPHASVYDDATRPIGLLSRGGHDSDFVVFVRGEMNQGIFAHFLANGRAIYLEREFYADAGTTDGQLVDALVNGFGTDWPGFPDDSRFWPGVIVNAAEQALAAQLRAKGAWCLEAEPGDESSIRTVAALLAKGQLRIHERCTRTLQAMKVRCWDDAVRDKKRSDPFVTFVASQSQLWRLMV